MVRLLVIPHLLFLAYVLFGCASAPKKEPLARAVAPAPLAVGDAAQREEPAFEVGPLYFDFDDDTLRPEALAALRDVAARMREDRGLEVSIEGHADDRGDPGYNLALGDRRGQAARRYLVRLGTEPARIRVVSFGEERPAVEGGDEAARAKNRRDELTFLSRVDREPALALADLSRVEPALLDVKVTWSE